MNEGSTRGRGVSDTYELTFTRPLVEAIEEHERLRPVNPHARRVWESARTGRNNSRKLDVPLDDVTVVLTWVETLENAIMYDTRSFGEGERIAVLKASGGGRVIARQIAEELEQGAS